MSSTIKNDEKKYQCFPLFIRGTLVILFLSVFIKIPAQVFSHIYISPNTHLEISDNNLVSSSEETQVSEKVTVYIDPDTKLINGELLYIQGVISNKVKPSFTVKNIGKSKKYVSKGINQKKETVQTTVKQFVFKTLPTENTFFFRLYNKQNTVVPANHYQPEHFAILPAKSDEIGNPLFCNVNRNNKTIVWKKSSPFFNQNFTRPPPFFT